MKYHIHFKNISITTIIMVIILAISCTVVFFGCEIYESDSDLAKNHMNQLITAIESGDSEGVKSLIAPNIAENIEDIDYNISELISFYSGSYVSDTVNIPQTTNDADNGIVKKWLTIVENVITTTATYCFCCNWCVKDTGDSGNVGIWSLYVFNYEDNPSEDFSFLADGYKNGIYVVKF